MGALEKWLEWLSPSSRHSSKYALIQFENHVKKSGEFKSLDEMVEFQQNAEKKDKYKIAKIAREYSQGKGGTYNSLNVRYGQIRSFFLYNEAALEKVPTNFHPTRGSMESRLDLDTFKTLVKASDLKDQAILLTLFQSLMDESRFQIFNREYAERLVKHLKENGVDEPFKIDFVRGRKRNWKPFHTFIGRDSLEAWRVYFDTERGWPKPGEVLALDQYGKAITSKALRRSHLYKLRKLGYVKETTQGKGAAPYGYGLHNLRDLARSILETVQGKRLHQDDPIEKAFKTSSAEYWMGHTLDPLGYQQIQKLDREFSPKQYRIAESTLNIISHVEHPDVQKIVDDRVADLEKRLESMQGLLEETIRREILPDMSVESAQSDLPPDVKVYPGPYDPLKRERGEWEQKFDTLKKLNPNERVEAMQKLIDEARETREEVRAEYIADMNEDEAIEQWRDRKAAYDAKFQAVKKLPANERVPALKKIIEEARKEKEDYSRQIADWENDVIMAEEAMIEEYQESHPRK